MVSQEPGLLTGSIADIIKYGQPSASDSEVEWAARAAQAHDFICDLPQGYQVRIGVVGWLGAGVGWVCPLPSCQVLRRCRCQQLGCH